QMLLPSKATASGPPPGEFSAAALRCSMLGRSESSGSSALSWARLDRATAEAASNAESGRPRLTEGGVISAVLSGDGRLEIPQHRAQDVLGLGEAGAGAPAHLGLDAVAHHAHVVAGVGVDHGVEIDEAEAAAQRLDVL